MALEAEAVGEVSRQVGREAEGGVRAALEDLFRRVGGHLFDLGAALGGGHDGDEAGGAVNDHAQVELLGDVAALFDVGLEDFFALGARLDGDQLVAKQVFGLGIVLRAIPHTQPVLFDQPIEHMSVA